MKKFILILTVLCVALFSVILGTNEYVKISTREKLVDNSEGFEAECILVFGCGVKPDGTPSDMLYDRIKRGAELYKNGAAPKLLMSGDHGRESYDEVKVMKNYAMEMGVPEEDIFMDHAGFSTYDSIVRAKKVFCCEKVILVTQKYHLYRALFIADKLGISAVGIGADYHIYRGQKSRDVREALARCKDFVACIVKPDPKFLGEAIPVSGDGRVTEG